MKNIFNKHRILIINFGSQYIQLLARRIREMGIYYEIRGWKITKKEICDFNPSGIILSGGPSSTTELNSPRAPYYVFKAKVPVLGTCYGMQTMVTQLGGKVKCTLNREFGYAEVEILLNSLLINNIKDGINISGNPKLDVWMSHGDSVISIPKDFIVVAKTKNCPFAIITNEKKHFYGLQFHPEVTNTIQGKNILKRFIFDICKCSSTYKPPKIIRDKIKYIKKKIGNNRVILGLSGGIDSSVTALLLKKAIGNNLICIFIDNGLLRLNESKNIISIFINYYKLNVIHIKAENRFFNALKGVIDPEHKRKTIGKIFIEIFEEQAFILNGIKWLAQGTICSDIVESKLINNGKSNFIKSHHNVGGLPKNININIIEPLKTLFKDEVKKIGLDLGLSNTIINRHPFPGPGFSIRILGEVKKEYCYLLKRADAIFIEELHKFNLYNKISQAFAIFLPIKSVGVMGDTRTYDWVISLRAVKTIDFMTAYWVHLPYDFLSNVSNRIINEVNGISHVVYDISSKPPSTIEWE